MVAPSRKPARRLETIATVAIGILFLAFGYDLLFTLYSPCQTPPPCPDYAFNKFDAVCGIVVGFALLALALFRARIFSRYR